MESDCVCAYVCVRFGGVLIIGLAIDVANISSGTEQ